MMRGSSLYGLLIIDRFQYACPWHLGYGTSDIDTIVVTCIKLSTTHERYWLHICSHIQLRTDGSVFKFEYCLY